MAPAPPAPPPALAATPGADVGGVELAVTHPCPRCTVPDVGQQSGRREVRDAGPMRTLEGYRRVGGAGVLFGVYLRPLSAGGSVRVGDAVVAA